MITVPNKRKNYCCHCSVAKSCLTLCHPVDCSTPSFPFLYYHPEFAQIHVHWLRHWYLPTISSSVTPSPLALNLSQYQGLFQWVGSLHEVARIFEFQLQHQLQFQLQHSASKPIILTRWTFVGQVISLLFNVLSRFVIAFFPRSKGLLILWLQSQITAILEPKKSL